MKNCSHWIVSAIFISNYSYSSAINLEPTEINQKWRVVVDPQTCWGFVLNQLKSFNISSFGTPRVNHQSKLSIYAYTEYIYTIFKCYENLITFTHLHSSLYLWYTIRYNACSFCNCSGQIGNQWNID